MLFKQRLHLFEFEDQVWFPQRFRNYITDILGKLVQMDFYSPLTSSIKKIMLRGNCYCIIDLCTGSGEAVLQLQKMLQKEVSENIEVILTDKYPNLERANILSSKTIKYLTQSINAINVPNELHGFRTIFASFHHFKYRDAKAILQDAVNNNMPIGVFEYTACSWKNILLMFIGFVYVFAITPFIRPLSWERLVWTYIIPIVPLVFFLDGIVSNLRTYDVDQLKKMVAELKDNHHDWEIGRYATKIPLMKVTYLIGCPKEAAC